MIHPLVRFAARHWLQWRYVAPLLIGIAVVLRGRGHDTPRLLTAAIFSLFFAVPYAAVRITDLDRDGRLDQLRLSGIAPGKLLFTTMIGTAAPWLAIGMVTLAAAAPSIAISTDAALRSLAMLAASLALSLVGLALPRGAAGVDSRMATIGVAVIALIVAVVFANAAFGERTLPPVLEDLVRRNGLLLIVLGVEALVIALALRRTLLLGARPGPVRYGRGPIFPSSLAPLTTVGPHLRRSLLVSLHPALLTCAVAVAALCAFSFWVPSLTSAYEYRSALLIATIVAFVPPAVGAFVISTTARADRESRRFDTFRTGTVSASAAVLSTIVGYLVPFAAAVLIILFIAAGVWDLDVREPLIFAAFAAAGAAPVPLIEGWWRRWPMTYTFPVAVGSAITSQAPSLQALITSPAVVFWVPWLCAIRLMDRPDEPPLRGWTAVIFAACVTLATAPTALRPYEPLRAGWLFAAIVVGMPLLARSRQSRAVDVLAAAAVFATLLGLLLAGYSTPLRTALLVPVVAGACWTGSRLLPSSRDAVGVRAALAAVAALGFIEESVALAAFIVYPPRPLPVMTGHIVVACSYVAVAALVEVAVRVTMRRTLWHAGSR